MENRAKGRKRPKSPGSARLPKKLVSTNQIQSEELTSSKSNDHHRTTANNNSKLPCFKDPEYRESGFAMRTKVWKNLKQIMALQKSQSSTEVLYASIDAPPSTLPVKKYSDISGLPALYSDPNTKLRYSNSDEYQQIQQLSSDTVIGLLALRRATY